MAWAESGRRERPDTDSAGRIIAHRGASGMAPENTLSAFREAARQGVDWIEFDVSLLGDGTPVIHHDHTLGRTTNRRGRLRNLSRSDLEGIDTGSWFDQRFRGEPLATLEAALDLIEELGLSANLEMKPHRAVPEDMARAVAAALRARPWGKHRILVSSFDVGALRALRRKLSDQPLAFICHRLPGRWRQILAEIEGAALHADIDYLRPDMLDQTREEGVDLRVFTANDPERVAALRDAGLTGVITDYPRRFLDDPVWAAWAANGGAAQAM